jgi:hypothetical protein
MGPRRDMHMRPIRVVGGWVSRLLKTAVRTRQIQQPKHRYLDLYVQVGAIIFFFFFGDLDSVSSIAAFAQALITLGSPTAHPAHPLLRLLTLCSGTAHPCSVTYSSLYHELIM